MAISKDAKHSAFAGLAALEHTILHALASVWKVWPVSGRKPETIFLSFVRLLVLVAEGRSVFLRFPDRVWTRCGKKHARD